MEDSPFMAAFRHFLRCAEKLYEVNNAKKVNNEDVQTAKQNMRSAQDALWSFKDEQEFSAGRPAEV